MAINAPASLSALRSLPVSMCATPGTAYQAPRYIPSADAENADRLNVTATAKPTNFSLILKGP